MDDVPACEQDVHDIALSLPFVTIQNGGHGKTAYQVGGKSFVLFRNPRPDAVDPATGERLTDVVVIWVASDGDKEALVQDETSPFFTTPHFRGHLSVLVRAARLPEVTRAELRELIEEAWLSRASPRRAATWLAEHDLA